MCKHTIRLTKNMEEINNINFILFYFHALNYKAFDSSNYNHMVNKI